MAGNQWERRTAVWAAAAVVWFVASAAGQDLRRGGFLGIKAGPVPSAVRSELHLGPGGVTVLGLLDAGLAKASGVEVNDIITEIAARPVAGTDDFADTARRLRGGDSVTVRIVRHGQPLTRTLLVKPRPYETSPDADVLYRAVAVDGALRRLIVAVPKTPGRHAAVLYMTGIGCFSQEAPLGDGTSETKLLYGLTRAGYVTLRVEKSGIGDSEGPSCSDPAYDLRAELQGYLAGLKVLKQYPFVAPDNVFLLGLSIGGVMAPQLANQEAVRGVVVVNTVSKPFLVYLLETRQRQMLLRHTPYDEIERRLRLDESCNHALLLEDRTPAEVMKANADCADFIEYPAPYTYMRQWAQLNIADTWKKVTAPVLIAYGTSDFVASNGDHPYLADMLNSFHPGQATLKAIAGMDHYLTKAASMEASMLRTDSVQGEFDPEILTVVQEWLDTTKE